MITPFAIDLESGRRVVASDHPRLMIDHGATDFLIGYFASGFNFVLVRGATELEAALMINTEYRTTFRGQYRENGADLVMVIVWKQDTLISEVADLLGQGMGDPGNLQVLCVDELGAAYPACVSAEINHPSIPDFGLSRSAHGLRRF